MRDFKGMKRQRGRNRSTGSNNGGKPQQQNANRAFESNGPEGSKVRGNAQNVFEKYQQLARDAGTAGDRVLAENYLQHAEHYFRVVRAMQPTKPPSEILGRDSFSSGFDIDFEDESGAQAAAAADAYSEAETAEQPEPEARAWREERPENRQENRQEGRQDFRQDRPRDDRPRDDRPRDDRPRDDRPREDRPRYRDDRPRDDRPRDDRPRNDQPRTDQPRSDQPREDRAREDRAREDRPRSDQQDRPRNDRVENGGRRDRWRDRDDRPRDDRPREDRPERDPLPVVEPQSAPLVQAEARPSPVLRDDDGGESHAPAFLKAPRARPAPKVAVAEVGEEVAKPVRRRAPRAVKTDET